METGTHLCFPAIMLEPALAQCSGCVCVAVGGSTTAVNDKWLSEADRQKLTEKSLSPQTKILCHELFLIANNDMKDK